MEYHYKLFPKEIKEKIGWIKRKWVRGRKKN